MRKYFYDLMRLKKLTVVYELLKMNYNLVGHTAFDDKFVFSQLEMDLISLKMKGKQWEIEQKLLIPVEEKDSPDHPGSEIKRPTSEVGPSQKSSDNISQLKPQLISLCHQLS